MSGAGEEADRLALVTGASRGIGRSVALALAGAGARVYALARDLAALEALAAESVAGTIVPIAVDLTDDSAGERVLAILGEAGAQLDVLVHSAGVMSHASLAEASVSELERQWRANVRGPYALTKALLGMLDGGSDVVFVNSSVTRNPRAFSGQYAATQHAMIGIANSLREELNALGVRVMSIYPGKTATPRQQGLHQSKSLEYRPELMLQADDVAASILHAVSLPRTAEITELHIRPLKKS